uniref:Uncharacterized protein n=1 Tax=Romanomermis culicivorax TaxID=13658 RepID=A0A915K8J1_ROMCU
MCVPVDHWKLVVFDSTAVPAALVLKPCCVDRLPLAGISNNVFLFLVKTPNALCTLGCLRLGVASTLAAFFVLGCDFSLLFDGTAVAPAAAVVVDAPTSSKLTPVVATS